MAKDLTFILNGTNYAAAPEKVERKKLYGWVDLMHIQDDNMP